MSTTDVAQLECAECGQVVPVTFTVIMTGVDERGDLQAEAVPDLTDVFAHHWSHCG